MRYLAIKGFDKHQHYKDRRPPWIKLHAEVLDDYAFTCLQDASKAHLMLLWVLASKLDNRIPYDLAFIARKLGATAPLDLEELIRQGFILVMQDDSATLASREQSAMPETEAETETEIERKPPVASHARRAKTGGAGPSGGEPAAFIAAMAAYPRRAGGSGRPRALKAWRASVRAGADPARMVDGVQRYAAYVRAGGKEGTEYVKQAATFFGPDRHWEEPWNVPVASRPATREAREDAEREARLVAEREKLEADAAWIAARRAESAGRNGVHPGDGRLAVGGRV